MRIKFIVPVPLDAQGVANRARQVPEGVISPGTEVVFVSVKNGGLADSPREAMIADFFTYEEGLRSEAEGFDAVCIDTVSDAALAPLRSRLRIPVVGPGQASFHLAAILGGRFSIVTLWQRWVHLYEKALREYEIERACASIRFLSVTPDVRNLLAGKEEDVFPALEAAARRCIDEDGARAIVLGSTTMHDFSHRFLAERLPVPVINPGLVAFKVAEMLVEMGLSHSKLAYASPQEPRDALFERAAAAVDVRPVSG